MPYEDRFSHALTLNKRMVSDAQAWMDRAKSSLDDYYAQVMDDTQFIAYDMLDSNEADDILLHGETVIDRNEKQKGYPSLLGLEA